MSKQKDKVYLIQDLKKEPKFFYLHDILSKDTQGGNQIQQTQPYATIVHPWLAAIDFEILKSLIWLDFVI